MVQNQLSIWLTVNVISFYYIINVNLYYFAMLTHYFIIADIYFSEAEEDTMEIKSEDDPQCVVHFPELMSDKPSRIILLSDRSYSKLIECKNIRMELGVEACLDQCETIPVPSYDPKKDGYHRPCYMKFVKVKTRTKTNTVENSIENQNNTQEEIIPDKSKSQDASYSDQNEAELSMQTDQNKAVQEIIHSDHSHTHHEISLKNHSKTKDEYSSGDRKTKNENFIEERINEYGNYSNEGQYENDSEAQCETVHVNYFDPTKDAEHKDHTSRDSNNIMKNENSESQEN